MKGVFPPKKAKRFPVWLLSLLGKLFKRSFAMTIRPALVRKILYLGCLVATGWNVCGLLRAQPVDGAFFEKEIRPILIAKCQNCHGPKKQESGFRVDSRQALLRGGENGPAIVAAKPGVGSFLKALSHETDLKMPPSGKLPPAVIAAMTRWIEQGAPWPEEKASATGARTAVIMPADRAHWAFQPLRKAPELSGKDPHASPLEIDRWILEIDRSIQAGWKSRNLQPAAPADRRTLIRRATLDLTGLPPTPGEIEAFLADGRPDAFSRLVDRLLESPAYGERWGRHWLDVARYADTAGDGADYPLPEAWRYRNWVIASFQKDQPYDQFLREQIAGDLLAKDGQADEYAARVTATGFLAIGKRYGYSPGPDYQHLDFADVIESVGRSVLGLSLGCARCHDHKYEPIGTADYYALYGIFQSTKWAFPGGEEHKKPENLVPLVPPGTVAKLEQERKGKLEQLAQTIRTLKEEKGRIDGQFIGGGADLGFEGQPLGKPPAAAWLSSGPNTIEADAQSPFVHVHPKGSRGVRMQASEPHDGVRYVFADPFKARPGQPIHFTIDLRNAPGTAPGAYRFYLGRGVIASTAVDCSVSGSEFAVKNGSAWEVIGKVEPGTWHTLRLTIDPDRRTFSGVFGPAGKMTSFGDKKTAPGWDGVIDTFICDGFGHKSGATPVHDLDNLGLAETAFAAPGALVVRPVVVGAAEKEKLAAIESKVKECQKESERLAAMPVYPAAYAVSEGTPGNARIQKRGEPDKLGPEVPRRYLEILGASPLKNEKQSGRLELAHWLTSPDNPLTARVLVNRLWQWHFGRGLVNTPSDFGLRGEAPTHPELLDLLAQRFIDSGWSIKAMHRLIMNSQTYQLASIEIGANASIDPENVYLWRYSRRPLEAEVVRDTMLFVSGKLNSIQPEAHPFPPVQTWGYTIHNPFHALYESDHRSVYLMSQRNRRHPFLALFDAADPNLSVAGRMPTTTPTQALFLMNSPFVHAQSAALATRLSAISGTEGQRLAFLAASTQGRAAADKEIEEGVAFLDEFSQRALSRGGSADAARLASWSALCRIYLTANATLHIE